MCESALERCTPPCYPPLVARKPRFTHIPTRAPRGSRNGALAVATWHWLVLRYMGAPATRAAGWRLALLPFVCTGPVRALSKAAVMATHGSRMLHPGSGLDPGGDRTSARSASQLPFVHRSCTWAGAPKGALCRCARAPVTRLKSDASHLKTPTQSHMSRAPPLCRNRLRSLSREAASTRSWWHPPPPPPRGGSRDAVTWRWARCAPRV